VVNGRPDIVERLDRYMRDKSTVIPVEKKKDGSFSARSSVMSEGELQIVSNYVNHKIKAIGQEILDGKVTVNPYVKGSTDACTYCAYKKVCGFDNSIMGYEKRNLAELGREEAMKQMIKTIQPQDETEAEA